MKNKTLIYSIASAILLLLSVPPVGLKWTAFFSLVPLFCTLDHKKRFWGNFAQGSLVGFPFFCYFLHWIIFYNPWIYIAVLCSYIPFFGIWWAISKWGVEKLNSSPWAKLLVPSVLFSLMCVIYDITSLRATGVQAMFYQNSMAWMQSTKYLGTYGPIFLVLLVNVSLALFIQKRSRSIFAVCGVTGVLCISNYAYGHFQLQETYSSDRQVALVQHNMTVDKKWWAKNHKTIRDTYLRMGREAAKENPELIIFPSYSLPFDSYRNPEFFERLTKEIGIPILISSYVPKEPNKRIADVGQYEMTILYTPEDGLVQYDRSVQAPPFRNINQVLAEETEVLQTPIGQLGILLCFEDAVAWKANEEVAQGADVIAAISNPAHFVHTFMPEYHLYQDQMRAIESGKFVMRVSARGYTAIIDPKGRILQQTRLDEEAILYGKVAVL